MPHLSANGLTINYEFDRSAGADAPVLLLSNSLGTTISMWDDQIAAFSSRYQVLRYDTRGHGASAQPEGPYSLDELGADVVALLDGLAIPKVHFCGLSLGGMIGQQLAIHSSDRLDKVVLCNTNAVTAQPDFWDKRIGIVQSEGIAAIADGVMARFFSPEFAAKAPKTIADFKAGLIATPPVGYAACCAAIRDLDYRADLATIKAKTLVIAGSRDEASPAENGKAIAAAIPGATYQEIDAAHISNIEAPERFSENVMSFLG